MGKLGVKKLAKFDPGTYVVLSDIQIPFHDPLALDVTFQLIEALQPKGTIINGDGTDCYEISDFVRNPRTHARLGREITATRKFLDRLTRVAPDSRRTWSGGNHEDRLRRTGWKHVPALHAAGVLDFPTVYGLRDYGVEWLPYGEGVHLGKLYVTHGSEVRKHSGETGRAHFTKYGQSVLIGHTHRLGAYYHTDLRGTHGAWENGCLCLLQAEYVQYPDWQQGFSVVHVWPNGVFSVQQVPIINRRTLIYGDKTYVSAANSRKVDG